MQKRRACVSSLVIGLSSVGVGSLGIGPLAARGATVVLPASLATTEGDNNYGLNAAFTAQQLFSGSAVAGLPTGASITGMQFRLSAEQITNVSADAMAAFDVRLGHATSATLGTTFVANEAADTVQTRGGAFTIPAGSMPGSVSGGTAPNAFGVVIPFTTPYVYTGGNLLITISYTDGTSGMGLDFSGNTPGLQIGGALGHDAATAISVEQSQGLPIQFIYTVPEPTAVVFVAASLSCITRRRRR